MLTAAPLWLLFLLNVPTLPAVTPVRLAGAGASFPFEVYREWMLGFKSYRSRFTSLNMSYEAVGSGTGKAWIKAGSPPLEYAGSDSLLSNEDFAIHTDLEMFPTVAGAVVLVYNLLGINSLILNPDTIVGIYNGTFDRWDHPEIARINPDIQLPSANITVVARADKSGTTEVFTRALSSFSAPWRQRYGIFSRGTDNNYRALHWDPNVINFFGKGTRGVTGLVMSIPYTISYSSVADARQGYIPHAKIINRAGNLVEPDTASIQGAMDDFIEDLSEHFTVSIVDGPGLRSYPLATYTHLIIRMTTSEYCGSVVELWRYIEWFISNDVADGSVGQLNFVSLSEKVKDRIREKILGAMMCQGQLVKSLVDIQMADERKQTQTWRRVLYITLPIALCVAVICGIFFIWQHIKINMSILKNEWKISPKRVEFRNDTMFSGNIRSRRSIKSWASNTRSSSGLSIGEHLNKFAILDNDTILLFRELQLSNTRVLRMNTRRYLLWMRDQIQHINLVKFVGLCEYSGQMYLLTHACQKGCLYDILQSEKFKLDWNFKFSIAYDIACGMHYLDKNGIIHGNLSSHTCYIDDRWTVKVGDWQQWRLAQFEKVQTIGNIPLQEDEADESMKHVVARSKFWTAPEMLMNSGFPTREADVYSFAILLVEIFNRDDPYGEMSEIMEPADILKKVKVNNLRPKPYPDFPKTLLPLLQHAWDADPQNRPTFAQIKKTLRKVNPSKKSVLDCMMEAIDGYVLHLEEKVSMRTKELETAIQQTTDLLHKMLPPSVALKLSRNQIVEAEYYGSATIFFSDIVGFTNMASKSTPLQVVTMLNDMYTAFDAVVNEHEVYKVETVGDAYMVVSGVPVLNGHLHAAHICSMALDLAIASDDLYIQHMPGRKLEYRAGIHCGPVCAGVVGINMPRYCIFGDTVNTASRMESTSVSHKIQVSADTKTILDSLGGFMLKERGIIEIKGKGPMTTYWLHGKTENQNDLPPSFLRDIPHVNE